MPAAPRPYRQVARAAAAADTRRRILDAFATALRTRGMDEITLDGVAAEAGTTRQTVIRLFGGKPGLLQATAERIKERIERQRRVPPGGPRRAFVLGLVQDYEGSGDMVMRLLGQEERHPELKPFLDFGRRWHRAWVEQSFARDVPAERRERCVTQLVVATDVYAWKLLRRDMGLAAAEVAETIGDMVDKILGEGTAP